MGKSFEETCFIYYFLKVNQSMLYDLQKGSAQPHVYPKDIKQIKIPIPPTSIQQKIISECQRIDTEVGKAKDKISELQEEINVIVANINGYQKKLGSIAKFKNGLNYHKSMVGKTIRIVGVADFKENKSPEWDKVQSIKIKDKVDDSFLLHKNDLLTVRSNGSRELVGRFMFIDKEPEEQTTFSGFSIRVRVISDDVDNEFLYYQLSSAYVRERLTTGSNGANIKSLNQDLLSDLEIQLPPLSEQKSILKKINEIEKEIASLKEICEGASERKKAVLQRELVSSD